MTFGSDICPTRMRICRNRVRSTDTVVWQPASQNSGATKRKSRAKKVPLPLDRAAQATTLTCRALLVDDNQALGRLFAFFLNDLVIANVECEQVLTVSDAVNHLKTHTVDIVFLDNRIPPFKSFKETAQMIRQATEAPIILLTGTDLDELGYSDIPAPLSGYLAKNDLSSERLLTVIQEFTSSLALTPKGGADSEKTKKRSPHADPDCRTQP